MFKTFRTPELDDRATRRAAFSFVFFVFWLEAFRFDVDYSEYFV